MMTNGLGPMRAVKALPDLVSPNGVIGVMSSGLGSIAGNESDGREVYRASKGRARHDGALVRCATRGRWSAVIAVRWVPTDMGGPHAPLGVEGSVLGIVDTIATEAGRTDIRFLDYRGRVVPW